MISRLHLSRQYPVHLQLITRSLQKLALSETPRSWHSSIKYTWLLPTSTKQQFISPFLSRWYKRKYTKQTGHWQRLTRTWTHDVKWTVVLMIMHSKGTVTIVPTLPMVCTEWRCYNANAFNFLLILFLCRSLNPYEFRIFNWHQWIKWNMSGDSFFDVPDPQFRP